VAVRSGTVQVSPTRGGEPVNVAAGEWAASDANGALHWSQPAHWQLADAWPDLNLVGRQHRAADASLRVTSVAYRPDVPNPHFAPQQQICLQSSSGAGVPVFTLPRSFWLTVRLRASAPGRALLTLDAREGRDADFGNYGSRRINVDQQWRDVVLRTADFHRDTDHSILTAGGWAVQTLCLWGMDSGIIEVESITLGELSEP
jgi:hypothetical protein